MPFLVHISDFVTMDIFQVPFHVRSPQGTATSQSFQTDLTNNLTLSNPMKIIPDFRSLGPATRYWLWKREGSNFQGFSVSNSNYFFSKIHTTFRGITKNLFGAQIFYFLSFLRVITGTFRGFACIEY